MYISLGTVEGEKGDFETLSQWREVGKAQIRNFVQQYTSHCPARIRRALQTLEREINGIERSLCTQDNPKGDRLLQGKSTRSELGAVGESPGSHRKGSFYDFKRHGCTKLIFLSPGENPGSEEAAGVSPPPQWRVIGFVLG